MTIAKQSFHLSQLSEKHKKHFRKKKKEKKNTSQPHSLKHFTPHVRLIQLLSAQKSSINKYWTGIVYH